MSEQTEITLINVTVNGARGTVATPDGEQPAYFFIVDDPETGKRYVVPLTEGNKDHVIKGWTGVEVASAMPAMAVPKGG